MSVEVNRPVLLVGAEFEENLSLRYLSAAVTAAGFSCERIAFNDPGDVDAVVTRVEANNPLVIGLSMPFQMRAKEFLDLATRLRSRGVRAHITIGGHFATFEYANLLRDYPAIDSVVRHEGEETLVELCLRLRDGGTPEGIGGLVWRHPSAGVQAYGKRALPALDDLPMPDRAGDPHLVMGIPVSPIIGSRGCYADCSFCCIYAYAENADGARYRRRSPEHIAVEMREEYTQRGARLFVFHDDNFFVPSRAQNLARYTRLKALLDAAGMTDIALVIKCRPNDVHHDLFALLKSMGLIRVYIGIETNSDEGIISLNRRITSEDNRRALRVLRDLDLYHSFNLLIFDPEATLDGMRRNLDFMQEFGDSPFNFCRAEVYAGTPLQQILTTQGRLEGDYFAWGYRMREPRVELLFRISSTVFASRNFKADGVANLNMGIRVDNEVARHFHPDAWDAAWQARLVDFSRRIAADSEAALRDALAFASTTDLDDHAAAKAYTLALARRVARADLQFVTECRALRRELEHRVVATRGDIPLGRDHASPPWAAESWRLGTSVGRDVSTERLPFPMHT
jgi:radical SAM superfamily enzyme YgiQ (UPF0313 family)